MDGVDETRFIFGWCLTKQKKCDRVVHVLYIIFILFSLPFYSCVPCIQHFKKNRSLYLQHIFIHRVQLLQYIIFFSFLYECYFSHCNIFIYVLTYICLYTNICRLKFKCGPVCEDVQIIFSGNFVFFKGNSLKCIAQLLKHL